MPRSRVSPHVAAAQQYSRDVLSGKIPACKWVKLACERQQRDLAREKTKEFPYRFDVKAAEKICAFIECLPNIKGKWGGTAIELGPWQCFILCVVFGWKRLDNGKRRFRTAYNEFPRKQGKSTLTSGIGLYLLTEDAEEGAEVYSAATTRDQARIVFADAQAMARRTPDLREHYGLAVNAHNINILRTSSKFEALSSEGDTLDGLNVHGALIDELHAHKTRAVWDVIETATGAREQSLLWAITTAGSNKTGICYEQRTYVTKLLDQVFEDETYFGIIYTIDDGDDWATEAAWKKANPNYGVSVFEEDVARLAHKAIQTPSAVNNFLTKRLNVWVQADAGLFDMRAWQECGDSKLKPEDFSGCPCWIAVDLAHVHDIAAVVKVFRREEICYVFGRYYLPENTVESSSNSQYAGWERIGRLIATDGETTDYEHVLRDVMSDLATFDVQSISFDPYNHKLIADPLVRAGVNASMLDLFPQTPAKMSPAIKQMQSAIGRREIRHDGCPVLNWAMSNVVGHEDVNENLMARKERPENLIDPATGLIMAHAKAIDGLTRSIYETRGMVVLG